MNAKEFYNKDRKTKVDFDSPQTITPKHSPEYVIDFAERYLLHIMSDVGIQTHAERQYQRILEDGNLKVNVRDLV